MLKTQILYFYRSSFHCLLSNSVTLGLLVQLSIKSIMIFLLVEIIQGEEEKLDYFMLKVSMS